jgi:hypothetical protein
MVSMAVDKLDSETKAFTNLVFVNKQQEQEFRVFSGTQVKYVKVDKAVFMV